MKLELAMHFQVYDEFAKISDSLALTREQIKLPQLPQSEPAINLSRNLLNGSLAFDEVKRRD